MQIKNTEGLSVSQIKSIVENNGRFVYFPYTISLVLVTFKKASSIYLIRPGEMSIKYSYKHVLVNGVLGWWGFPWGPIYTLGSLFTQIGGGKNVTNEVMSELIQNDPEANTTTYNINGVVSSNAGTQQENSTYNIPR